MKDYIQKHLPTIEKARREDAEYYEEEDDNDEQEEEGARKANEEQDKSGDDKTQSVARGTVKYKDGTMLVKGTLVKPGSSISEAAKAAMSQGTLKRKGDLASGDVAKKAGMLNKDDESADGEEKFGTYVYRKNAASDAEDDEKPAFLRHFLSGFAGGAESSANKAKGESGNQKKPGDGSKSVYDVSIEELRKLTIDDLEDKLTDVDAQFRHDMNELTTKYDKAKTAIEDVIAEKSED